MWGSEERYPRPPRAYLSFLLRGDPEEVEIAVSRLFEAGCLGAVEVELDDTAEGLGQNQAGQRVYFSPGTDSEIVRRLLGNHFPSLRCGAAEPVPESDWLAAWKKDFSGFSLGKRFYVSPSWERPPKGERLVIRIDPERAFGTGTHDTTRLCLELIEDRAHPRMSVIDAGCGTGILAIAAAALGCRPVQAIEEDPEAASYAATNLDRNGLTEAVHLQVVSITQANPLPAQLLLANLNQAVLLRELPRLAAWVLPQGYLILSGLLLDQIDSILERIPVGFCLTQTRTAGEWAALLVRHEADA